MVADDTEAYVTGGVAVTAGRNINITADNKSVLVGGTLAVSVGGTSKGAGLAGSLALDVMDRTTKAYADNATLSATGDITVKAASLDVDASATAGGGGSAPTNAASVGVVGAFDAHALVNDTEAYLSGTAVVKQARNVTLDAENKAVVVSAAGGVAIGGGTGVGAGLDGQAVLDKAKAFVGAGARVAATGDVSVTADDTQVLDFDRRRPRHRRARGSASPARGSSMSSAPTWRLTSMPGPS